MSTETTKAVPFLSEKTLLDAPLGYSNAEASAWASGYNSAADDAQAELTRLRQLLEEARKIIEDLTFVNRVGGRHVSYSEDAEISDLVNPFLAKLPK